MELPTAADIAREIPAMAAEAGGSLDLVDFERHVSRMFLPRIHAIKHDGALEYLHQAFNDAITIVVRNGLINSAGTLLLLSDKGWEQASTIMAERRGGLRHPVPDECGIDMSSAEPVIEYRHYGAVIRAYLSDDADRFHGKPLTITAAELLDEVYRAEVDDEPTEVGLYTALCAKGVVPNIADLIARSGIKLPGMSAPPPARGTIRRRGRKPGATWPRVVCEVIAEAGGHADWATIADATARRPEAENDIAWREEIRQALRNNTTPQGRCYFEAAQIGEKAMYALTESGRNLASKRTLDDRAPTLSKYLATAADSQDSSQLTDMELYALLFLATRLGRPAEAQAIYHRLPRDFPDEDSYAMIPLWIEQAESVQGED